MVGATNVANETKEFKPAPSFHLLGRFGAASGVKGTKEFATQTRTGDRVALLPEPTRLTRDDGQTRGNVRGAANGAVMLIRSLEDSLAHCCTMAEDVLVMSTP
jgi:hypothetical protein